MKTANRTVYSILGILSISSMSGYEIKKVIDESIGFFWNESYGKLYPTLKDLESKNFVTVESSFTGNKEKKIYTITELGKEFLNQWLAIAPQEDNYRIEALLKLFFFRNADKELATKLLNQALNRYESKLIELKETHKKLSPDSKDFFFSSLTLDYGIRFYSTSIEWAKESLEKIKNYEK